MNTWNTVLRTSVSGLASAIFVLETLGDKQSEKILDCLCAYEQCTHLDLLVHTGMDSEMLESLLDQLIATRVVRLESDIFGSHFSINHARLEQVVRLAKNITKGLR